MSASSDSLKSILYALGANALIAIAKLCAAVYTGSSAMLAEAVHSMADTANQGLLIWGLKTAKRPPSPDYPLGWGKAVYFWSFIVAVMLFSLGGLFAVYEGLHKLAEPQEMEAPWIAVGVLVFSVVVELGSLWGCLHEINKARGKRSLWAWIRESRQSELLVVLGEDVAALCGLVLALIAVGLSILTENSLFDALGSIGVGLMLIVVAVFVGTQIKGMLIGKSVEPALRVAIAAQLHADPAISRVFNLITLQLGSQVMVAVKAQVAGETAAELVDQINRIEVALKRQFPEIAWLFFEPDCED
ncbi:MAG: cation diffusion facilitator family transporter [Burkholderiales bacterium]|nr:cation diffusion facilitator family transporter [Burkholderiales bacterium]